MRSLLILFILISFLSCTGLEKKPDSRPAKEIVTSFYQDYMDAKVPWSKTPKNMNFSRAFNDLSKENHTICALHAKTDICGWDASGDIYLDTQDVDKNLNFKNSRFMATEALPGKVDVEFRVYNVPHRVRYVMIQEDGEWVVDDILYNGKSTRQRMKDEITYYYLHK